MTREFIPVLQSEFKNLNLLYNSIIYSSRIWSHTRSLNKVDLISPEISYFKLKIFRGWEPRLSSYETITSFQGFDFSKMISRPCNYLVGDHKDTNRI